MRSPEQPGPQGNAQIENGTILMADGVTTIVGDIVK